MRCKLEFVIYRDDGSARYTSYVVSSAVELMDRLFKLRELRNLTLISIYQRDGRSDNWICNKNHAPYYGMCSLTDADLVSKDSLEMLAQRIWELIAKHYSSQRWDRSHNPKPAFLKKSKKGK